MKNTIVRRIAAQQIEKEIVTANPLTSKTIKTAIQREEDKDEDAESDMSDDMLGGGDGSLLISTFAATLKEPRENKIETKRCASPPLYKPKGSGQFMISNNQATEEDEDSSGVETEVEEEPEVLSQQHTISQTSQANTQEIFKAVKETMQEQNQLSGEESSTNLRATSPNLQTKRTVSTAKMIRKNVKKPIIKERSDVLRSARKKKKARIKHSTEFSTNSSEAHDSLSSQEEEPQKQLVIMLTGFDPTKKIRELIHKISGARFEEKNIQQVTHLIAPSGQLKRTVKLLCGISCCDHILDEKWLEEASKGLGIGISMDSSSGSSGLVGGNEKAFCLKDVKAEKKWDFDLYKTMYEYTKDQRQLLFQGHQVYITNHKSILPPVKDLIKIVECAGGKVVKKGSSPSSTDLIVTSEQALKVSSIQKTIMAHANPERIFTAELILTSILQQQIDFQKHRLVMMDNS
jgi:hypothetical protein